MSIIDQLRAAGVECHTRAEWGSPQERAGAYARRRSTHPMPAGPARYHFLHITVTSDTDTVKEGAAGARQIETYGYSTPPMVSYQDLVTNEGRYFEGQSYGVKGTHTVNDKKVAGYPENLNYYGYATALMQNVGDQVTDEQVQVVAMIFAARELAGLVRKGAPIIPHRFFAWKSCPGDKAVARLDEIKRLRDKYVREGLPKLNKLDPKSYYPGTYGDHVRWIGRRLVVHGCNRHGDSNGYQPGPRWSNYDRLNVRDFQIGLGVSRKEATGYPTKAQLVALARRPKKKCPREGRIRGAVSATVARISAAGQ